MSVLTQSATATASKVAIGIALGASAAFAAVSLNDLFNKDPQRSGVMMPLEGGTILTREACWRGCEETNRMCTESGGDATACRAAFDACAESCLAYPPADTLPGYVPPGYVPPAYDVPGYAMPGYIVPGYDVPGYMTPGYVPPAPRPRAGFCLDRCVGIRSACIEAGRPESLCDERAVVCGDTCPYQDELPPGYIPPPPASACQNLCIQRYEVCLTGVVTDAQNEACYVTFSSCNSICLGLRPEADQPPVGTDADPMDPIRKPPINTRPPEYVNDNPPDPIIPGIDTTYKPQEYVKPQEQEGTIPQNEMKPPETFYQEPSLKQEEPKAEEGFFDKVWDFFAGDKKE